MEDWVILYIVIIDAIVCAVLSAILATKKGHSGGAWFFVGLLFGLFGLIAAAGLPTKGEPNSKQMLKKCPKCFELIPKEAKVCKYCRREFSSEEIISGLAELLRDKDIALRLRAVEALGTIGDKSILSHLISALDDDAIQVRHKAIEYLCLVGDKSAIPSLIKVLRTSDTYIPFDKIREAIIELGDSSVIPELGSILRDKDGFWRNQDDVCKILAEMGDPAAVPTLIEALRQEDIRSSAREAIVKIGKPSLPYLTRFMTEEKKSFRKLLETIVKDIESRT